MKNIDKKVDIKVISGKNEINYSVLDSTENRQRGFIEVKLVDNHYAIFSDIRENPLKYGCNESLIGIAHSEEEANARSKNLAERWAEYLRLNPPKPEDYNLL